ncbi:hypothetical protein Micbo1qcDRAFT_157901 [Microdochium bolleyi]|uniref:Uncharacterized protein n=1 Tax=Microdochium bolleyi TaxID=196109 RepID=A0A136JF79_9PEZI|nr:hypothetical protein Micbo1qcDRAFT_157901 [Microdochium bolleyi]
MVLETLPSQSLWNCLFTRFFHLLCMLGRRRTCWADFCPISSLCPRSRTFVHHGSGCVPFLELLFSISYFILILFWKNRYHDVRR